MAKGGMTVKRVRRIGLVALLCAALLALSLGGILLSCHHCSGEGCAVCLAVGEALRLARTALVLTAACALSARSARARRENGPRAAFPYFLSLIDRKTELLR